MNNNAEKIILNLIVNALKKINASKNGFKNININHPKHCKFGDYTTNIAFKINSEFNLNPMEMASKIVKCIDNKIFSKIEIIKPGFINFFLKKNNVSSVIKNVIQKNELYGSSEKKNKKINIEFVSANPTGDLHVGHIRGAVYGDSLSRIMSFAGYDVVKEYYVNDAGNQIKNLAESVYQRYLQLFNYKFQIPKDGYYGDDIIKIANFFKKKYKDALLIKNSENFEIFKRISVKKKMNDIRVDLKKIRVTFDVFTSESKICQSKKINNILKKIKSFVYVKDGAKFLKTSHFLDDKDRVILKQNGDFTYFLPDIAYHFDKINRGFDLLIDVLGSDHYSYISRMKSAIMMLGYSADILKVLLIQLVKFVNNQGKEIRMSKRKGNTITLKDLMKKLDTNTIRYFFLTRSNNAHLDFNFSLAVNNSTQNPAHYIIYAHARLNSVLELAKNKKINIDYSIDLLNDPIEIKILKQIQEFPFIVDKIAQNYKIHIFLSYIFSFASLIHSYYNKCRIIDENNLQLSSSRLGLTLATKIVLANALKLIGIEALNKM